MESGRNEVGDLCGALQTMMDFGFHVKCGGILLEG